MADSAVVGVRHPDFGEVGVALEVARPGQRLDPEAILAALRARLANYKIPKRCVVVDELPRTAVSKVQKNLLLKRYRDSLAGRLDHHRLLCRTSRFPSATPPSKSGRG